jgi:hypothetical protein
MTKPTGNDSHAPVSEEAPAPDAETLSQEIKLALAPGVAMPERAFIDERVGNLTRLLPDLLVHDYGYDEKPQIRALFATAYRLLDLERRPTPDTSRYAAWQYMQNLARISAAFRDLEAERQSSEGRS